MDDGAITSMNTQKPSFHGYLLRQPKLNVQEPCSNLISIAKYLEKVLGSLPIDHTANDTLWNEEISQPDKNKHQLNLDTKQDNLWILPEDH